MYVCACTYIYIYIMYIYIYTKHVIINYHAVQDRRRRLVAPIAQLVAPIAPGHVTPHHDAPSRSLPFRAVPCRSVPFRAVPCRAMPFIIRDAMSHVLHQTSHAVHNPPRVADNLSRLLMTQHILCFKSVVEASPNKTVYYVDGPGWVFNIQSPARSLQKGPNTVGPCS